MTKQSVLEQAKTLSKQEQMELAMDVFDLADGLTDPLPLSAELIDELRIRLDEDLADKTPPEDWNVLRAKLLRGEI